MSGSPNIVGVLDLLDGEVVRAIGGKRDGYRPIRSRLCDSSTPMDVARAFRQEYAIDELYVADLDAIRGSRSNDVAIADLIAAGFHVTLDAGFRDAIATDRAAASGVGAFVAALETLPSFEALEEFIEALEPDRLWFSLDLADGVPMADASAWRQAKWSDASPLELADQVAAVGITSMIVLDLKAVGTSAGPATMALCRRIKARHPRMTLWSGGGIRTTADVLAMRSVGVDGVLVASALHDRTLDPRTA